MLCQALGGLDTITKTTSVFKVIIHRNSLKHIKSETFDDLAIIGIVLKILIEKRDVSLTEIKCYIN